LRRAGAIILGCLLGPAACVNGPGRTPLYADAEEYPDSTARDASPLPDAQDYDAEPPTDAMVRLPDAGMPGTSMFTGVFGILNDTQDPLYAREVDHKLNLVVGRFPYEYTGTIQSDGTVDARSSELMRSGCVVARIYGSYERSSGLFHLVHETCNAMFMTLTSSMTGGFASDFAVWSGVYDLQATVVSDTSSCAVGIHTVPVRYGFSLLAHEIFVFTADDLISTPQFYGGAWSGTSFSAIWRSDVGGTIKSTITGQFSQPTANDPVHFSGTRDVYDPVKTCSFSITLAGYRSMAP
jgi:hypothetical protein